MDNRILETLLQDSPLLGSLSLLLLTLILAYLVPLPLALDPRYYWQQLCRLLGAKTCKSTNSSFQQTLAGTLAALLLIVPWWLMLILLPMLAYYPWFFEGLLLYISFIGVQVNRQARRIQGLLLTGEKDTAKIQLQTITNADTHALSVIGISKATIEAQLTTPARTLITALCYFPLGGVVLVLLVRMINELAFCWPKQDPKYQFFAQSIYTLDKWLQWLPELIWQSLVALLYHQPMAISQAFVTRKQELPQILTLGARSLATSLGGPQMFSGQKVVRPKLVYGAEPYAATIDMAYRLTRRCQGFIMCFCCSLPLIWIALRLAAPA
ncbi:MAG: cobalamin biosynthesis protein [Shewanella sp.]